MKTMILAAVFAAFAGAASAELIGSLEYGVETESVEATVGLEAALDERITASFVLNGEGTTDVTDMQFTGMDVNVGWELDSMTTLYGNVELDEEFEYTDATVGVAFRF